MAQTGDDLVERFVPHEDLFLHSRYDREEPGAGKGVMLLEHQKSLPLRGPEAALTILTPLGVLGLR